MILSEIRGTGVRKVLYGWIMLTPSGKKIYVARRKHREIYRSGNSSISGAMKEETASWAIDESTLFAMRAKKVEYIGVYTIDTGDFYWTPIKNYFDRTKSKLIDFTGIGRGGSRQKIVALQHFTQRKASVRLDADKLVSP